MAKTMYPAQTNSPEVVTRGDLTASSTSIQVSDGGILSGIELPFPVTLGKGSTAETVLVTAIVGDVLTVTRAFEGFARSWAVGTALARNFTAYDHNAFIENIKENAAAIADKVEKVDGKGLSDENYTADEKAKLTSLHNYDDTILAAKVADLDADSHIHANKTILDGISSDKVTSWDSAVTHIVTDLTPTTKTQLLVDNTEYQFGTLTALTLTVPAGQFTSWVGFASGGTKTTLSVPTGTKCIGTDCTGGVFAPVASKRYGLGIWYDGVRVNIAVGGV